MANTKKNKPAKESKLETVEKMLANKNKREADKQRKIYSAMAGITVVRN